MALLPPLLRGEGADSANEEAADADADADGDAAVGLAKAEAEVDEDEDEDEPAIDANIAALGPSIVQVLPVPVPP